MQEARPHRPHPDEITIARRRILDALKALDIDFCSSMWVPHEATRSLTATRIDWELFFRERSFRAHAHPSLKAT
jgi:hypothetical protein